MSEGGRVELVTVLFSDLVGSTAQRVAVGEEAADRLRAEHDGAVVGAIDRHAGRVVKHTGDGVMAIFNGASDGVAAAVALQQAITRASSADPATAFRVRVGLSAGDVTVEGDDCFGLPVVEAQRLEAAAEPGQILCAGLVRALAHGRGAHEFRSVGALELKGLDGPLEADEVLWTPLPEEHASRELPPVVASATGFPMAGRDEHLAAIEHAWHETTEGATRVVLLAGEPGAGKTRLAGEAARRIAASGGVVLAGRSDEHVPLPYQPFAEALAFQLECDGSDIEVGSLGHELQRLVPELAAFIPGLDAPLSAEPDAERMKLFDAVRSWLSAVAAAHPVVLLLDDLHWADLGTVLLLRHVAISVPVEGLLVLSTYRDTDIDRAHPLSSLLSELRRAGSVTRLAVKGLESGEVKTLFALAAGHSLDDAGMALAQAVHAETSGNAFFVGEVLRHLVETGAIAQRDGRWVARDPDAAVVLPEGIRDVVGRRVSALPDETQRVLSVAAVVGPEFALDVVAAVGGLDDDAALDALEPALNAQLLHEVGVGVYRFAHALVQSTLEGELSTTRQARMHRRIGETLEKLHGDDPNAIPDLARHWAAASAGHDPTALAHVRRAAEQALAQVAPAEAARWYRVALDLIDDDPHLEAELLLLTGKAESSAGLPSGPNTLLEAARRAEQLGDIDIMRSALLVSKRRSFDQGQDSDPDKMALLERAIAQVADDDADRRAPLLAELAIECIYTGDLERRLALVREAETLGPRMTGDARRLGLLQRFGVASPRSLQNTAFTRSRLATYRDARSWIDGASTDLRLEFSATQFFLNLWLGERASVDAALSEYRALVAQTGHPRGEDALVLYESWYALVDGRLDDAERHAKELRARYTAHAVPETETATFYDSFQLQLARERGLFREAGGAIAANLLTRSGQRRPDVLSALAALILVEAGQLDDARAVVDERSTNDFADIPDEAALPVARAAWAEASAATQHQRAAAAMYELLAPDPDAHLVTGAWYLGSAERYLALLADTLDRPDEADTRFATAVTAHERMATPPWLARTLLDWADLMLARGDASTARERAERALSVVGQLPLTAQRTRAEHILALG